MNRTDIAQQVRTTLGGHDDSFDLDGILDDLDRAGVNTSVDDIDPDTYWTIIRQHDTGADAEAEAAQAHADYVQAEAAYKEAIVRRQIAFARAVDAMGRGGNATLARKVGLSEPTVKSIADRGRALIAAAATAPELAVGDRVTVSRDSVPEDWTRTGEIEDITDETVVITLDDGHRTEVPDSEVTRTA